MKVVNVTMLTRTRAHEIVHFEQICDQKQTSLRLYLRRLCIRVLHILFCCKACDKKTAISPFPQEIYPARILFATSWLLVLLVHTVELDISTRPAPDGPPGVHCSRPVIKANNVVNKAHTLALTTP